MTADRRWSVGPAVVALTVGLGVGVRPAPSVAASSTTITVDGSSGGLVFDGEGAISGGGGNTRLLTDYPAAQQNAILDFGRATAARTSSGASGAADPVVPARPDRVE